MADISNFSLGPADLSPEQVSQLERLSGEKKFRWMRLAVKETLEHLSNIKPVVKDVSGFWLWVLVQHSVLKQFISSTSDQHALSYLSDIELKQDEKDPRPFEIVFHFRENPYFTNSTLSKTYSLPKGVKPAPEDGSVTAEMAAYDSDLLEPKGTKIDWKSDDVDLCAKQPRTTINVEDAGSDEEYEGDQGSFFWYFQDNEDPFGIGITLQDEILPDAFDFYNGTAEGASDDESFAEDELDEDTDEGSVDLEAEDEQPKKKKQKQ